MSNEGFTLISPPHPGSFIRSEIIEANELTVIEGAQVLGVTRPTLANLLNEQADLSPEMGLRIEKAFGVKMDTLMRMQNAYDIAQARSREGEINVSRFVPKEKDSSQPSLL